MFLEPLCFPKLWLLFCWLVPEMWTETKCCSHFSNVTCETLHKSTKQRKSASLSSSHLAHFEYIAKWKIEIIGETLFSSTPYVMQTEALFSYIKASKFLPSLFGQIVKEDKSEIFVRLDFLLSDKTCVMKFQVHIYEKEEKARSSTCPHSLNSESWHCSSAPAICRFLSWFLTWLHRNYLPS